ncbi:MAG: hypothetical protein IJ112_00460 [Oscillospiraceae bacterium]|nr:hypothetical protein [Oscillospiraceae bacterium]
MRREYQKPMLYAESFTLTEHITSCSRLHSAVNLGDPDNGCGYSLNGPNPGTNDPILFVMDITGSSCTDAGDLSLVERGGAICYNFFMDEGTLMFGS